MRLLVIFTFVLAGLWAGYWIIGSTAKTRVIELWFEDRRAAGWTAEYSEFRVRGFPSRFDSGFKDLRLRSPRSGIGWQAPEFFILALSYKPNHIIAAFPQEQRLSLPSGDITVRSQEMFASVVFDPDTNLAVNRISLSTSDLVLEGDRGWRASAQDLLLATRQNTASEFAHDVVFDANKVTPTVAFRRGLDPRGSLPATIERLLLDLTLGFTAPWDRQAIESGTPQVTSITVNRMNLSWGALSLKGEGQLDVARSGRVSGRLELEILNWREVLELFVTSGILDAATAGRVRQGLVLLTIGSDDPNSLKVPLTLKDGEMSLGPIALGPAPRFIR
jgi:hypothetical protein